MSYGAVLKADGSRPMIWSMTDGNLPSGLNLTTDGIITGTPEESGTFSFTVQVQNSGGTDTKTFALKINSVPSLMRPTITTMELEPGISGANYIFQLSAAGTPPITWSLAPKKKMPKGMELSSSGLISGTMTKTAKTSLLITATNAYGTTSKSFTLYSYVAPEITTTELKDAEVNKTYSITLKTKGTKPLKWEFEGSLPNGLTFDTSKGTIKGKATVDGVYRFRVRMSNPVGDDVRIYTLKVNASVPKVSTTKLSNGTVGKDIHCHD